MHIEKRVCPLSTRDIVARILVFIESLGEVKFYTYQSLFCRRLVESVLEGDGAIITALFSRQSGKTETIGVAVVGLAVILPSLAAAFPDDPRLKPFMKGFWAGVYAPILEQAQISFERMRNKVNSDNGQSVLTDPEIRVKMLVNRGDSLSFSNGSYIYARTASPDSQIEGKTYHLCVIEEAQKILRSKVEKEIKPMLTATGGSLVLIGTAWESRGGFHQVIQQNLTLHEQGGPRNHFEIPYDIVIDEKRRAFEHDGNPLHLKYEQSVENIIKRLGGRQLAEHNPEFQMNYMCLWRESRALAIRQDIFHDAALSHQEIGVHRRNGMRVAGLDIGKVSDSSVLTVMDIEADRPVMNQLFLPESDEDKQRMFNKTIIDWLELSGSFEGSTGQYQKVVEYLMRTDVKILVVDATSIGDPFYERLDAMLGGTITVVPYKFSSMSKSILYKYYLQEFHSGRVKYVAGPATRQLPNYMRFVDEHLELDKLEKGGYVVCEAPEGGHDDYPDSAALACWAEKVAESVIMPEIVTSTLPQSDGQGRWSRGTENMGEVSVTADASRGQRAARYSRRW